MMLLERWATMGSALIYEQEIFFSPSLGAWDSFSYGGSFDI